MIVDRLPELQESLNRSSSRESLVLIEDDEVDEYFERERNPVMDALLKMYNEMLNEFDLILANIDSMQIMTQAKNSKEFSEREFYRLRQRSTQIGNNLLIKFQSLEGNLPPEDDYSALARMKRLLYYGFFQQYVNIWSKNEEFLMEYEQRIKKNLQMQSQILNYHLTDEEIDTLIAHKQTTLYTGNIIETEHARKTLKALQDRLGELKKLEKSIEEVHTLFIRLQNLVVDQSVVMQRIEKHFNDARDYVEKGAAEIKQAQTIQTENRKNKFMFIIIAGITAVVLFIIISIFASHSPPH